MGGGRCHSRQLEDLNQIFDQDIYKNNPATGQSPFHVGAVLLHPEELLDIGKTGDSVAGLPRFLIAHFLSVCSKVCPENTPQEMRNLLLEEMPCQAMRAHSLQLGDWPGVAPVVCCEALKVARIFFLEVFKSCKGRQ